MSLERAVKIGDNLLSIPKAGTSVTLGIHCHTADLFRATVEEWAGDAAGLTFTVPSVRYGDSVYVTVKDDETGEDVATIFCSADLVEREPVAPIVSRNVEAARAILDESLGYTVAAEVQS